MGTVLQGVVRLGLGAQTKAVVHLAIILRAATALVSWPVTACVVTETLTHSVAIQDALIALYFGPAIRVTVGLI